MSISAGQSCVAPKRIPRGQPPHPQALELISDLLLESAGRDEEYPAYSEDQLERRALRSNRRQRLNWSQYTYTDVLLSDELDDLSEAAGLTGDERSAWMMYLDGHLPEEVAEALCTTRPRAVRLLNSARSRVASCRSRSRGLYSAYLSLIRRCTYHPQHGE